MLHKTNAHPPSVFQNLRKPQMCDKYPEVCVFCLLFRYMPVRAAQNCFEIRQAPPAMRLLQLSETVDLLAQQLRVCVDRRKVPSANPRRPSTCMVRSYDVLGQLPVSRSAFQAFKLMPESVQCL